MVEAFFVPDGDGFAATPLTRGPWDKNAQHAGPPAGLVARAVELALPPGFRLARVSIDILRPVPLGHLVPRATVTAGRRVARAQAVLEADGVEVMFATAMGQAVADLDLAPVVGPAMPPPQHGQDEPFFLVPWDEGYHRPPDPTLPPCVVTTSSPLF